MTEMKVLQKVRTLVQQRGSAAQYDNWRSVKLSYLCELTKSCLFYCFC